MGEELTAWEMPKDEECNLKQPSEDISNNVAEEHGELQIDKSDEREDHVNGTDDEDYAFRNAVSDYLEKPTGKLALTESQIQLIAQKRAQALERQKARKELIAQKREQALEKQRARKE